MHVLRHSVCVCINGLGVHRVLSSERLSVLPHCGEILPGLQAYSPHFHHNRVKTCSLSHTQYTQKANKTKAMCLDVYVCLHCCKVFMVKSNVQQIQSIPLVGNIERVYGQHICCTHYKIIMINITHNQLLFMQSGYTVISVDLPMQKSQQWLSLRDYTRSF